MNMTDYLSALFLVYLLVGLSLLLLSSWTTYKIYTTSNSAFAYTLMLFTFADGARWFVLYFVSHYEIYNFYVNSTF